VLVGALIALFCTFFFLHDPRGIWGWVVGLLPMSARERVNQAGRRGAVTLAAYTRTQILVAAVDAVGIGIGAVFFVPSLALPISILVFVGSFVPVVGAIVTGAIAVVVVLVSNGWVAALIMLGVVLLVQQIESHALQPFLMGQAVSLHPVAVILAVAAGSYAAGIVGALFAVPLAAVLNTVILYLNGHDKFPELGDEDALPIRWRAADAPPIPLRLRRGSGVVADSAVAEVGVDEDHDVPEGDPKR
jgi:predicted PurR-regulated permease PerM